VKLVALLIAGVAALAFPPAARSDLTVVEYLHAGFGHYFITANPAEIAALDARQPPLEQWSRTGSTFRAFDAAGAPPDAVAICRFFNASFAPKSSHFYAPKGLGCEVTIAQFPDWQLEDDKAFYAKLPDATGACPAGLVPVYRLYNNGRNGAPNHRFVTSLAERQAMLALGFLAEGTGIGVGMCVPPAPGKTTAEGYWRGTSNQGDDLFLAVLGDQQYFLLYTSPGEDWPDGAVNGNGTYQGSQFRSTLVRSVPFDFKPLPGGFSPIVADFVPGQTLALTNGTTSASLAYDAAYDQPVPLASLAGSYLGIGGHRNDYKTGTRTTVAANGTFAVQGVECDWTGTITPRGATAAFDVTLVLARGICPSLPGVAFYDAAKKRLTMLAPFEHATFPDTVFGIGDRE
jgi:hypothetical protein